MSPNPPSPFPLDSETEASTSERILKAAQAHLLSQKGSGFTMEELAQELGMSKKTLYLHFPGKEAILGTIIEGMGHFMRARLESIARDEKRTSTEKLSTLIETVGQILGRIPPGLLRDLKRNEPHLYAKLDEIRKRNVPYIFGLIIEEGLREGLVRPEIDAKFAAEFWLHAMRGLLDPETLERNDLTPKQTLEKAARIFFQGLLTETGRTHYLAQRQASQHTSIL